MTITLDWLHARCREEDGHLIWLGHHNDGLPIARIDGQPNSLRRTVWELTRQRKPGRFRVVCKCDTWLCVSPDCLAIRSPSAVLAGRKQSQAEVIAAVIGKRKRSKLSDESVQAIRADERPGKAVAVDYGVSQSYVSQIKRQQSRRDFGSPFAGLLAASERSAA